MPVNLTDVDEFTSPVTAPAGGDARIASSFGTPLQQLANRTHYLNNRADGLEGRIETLEDYVRTDLAGSHGLYLPAHRAVASWDSVLSRPEWAPGSTTSTVLDVMSCHSSGGRIVWSIAGGGELPTVALITAIRVWVKPASASGDRMSAVLQRVAASGFTPVAVGSPVEDDGTTNIQALTFSGINIRLASTDSSVYGHTNIALQVRLHGRNASAPTGDFAYFCEVRYTTETL